MIQNIVDGLNIETLFDLREWCVETVEKCDKKYN